MRNLSGYLFGLLIVCPGPALFAQVEAAAAAVPNDEECRTFFKTIEKACFSSDPRRVAALFDWDAVVARSFGELGTDKTRADFKRGFVGSSGRPGHMIYEFAQLGRRGWTLKLMRTRVVKGKKRMLMRQWGNGVNYHEFVIAKDAKGKLRIIDDYIFLSGELLSATLRRVILPLVKKPGFLSKLVGAENEFVKHMPQVQKITRLLGRRQLREALAEYEKLPESLQTQKSLLLIRLNITLQLGDQKIYAATLGDFRKHHPKDACIDLLSIDWHLTRSEHAEAIACLQRVDQSVGGDPALWVMQGNLCLMRNDADRSAPLFEKAAKVEPTLKEAHVGLLSVALSKKRHADTARILTQLIDVHRMPLGNLAADPKFKNFVQSEEYRAWAKARQAKASAKKGGK